MVFGAVDAIKKDLANNQRQKVYRQARELGRIGASQATDDDLRVLYQAIEQRNVAGGVQHMYALASRSSIVGTSLRKQELVRYDAEYDQLILTARGRKLNEFLVERLRGVQRETVSKASRALVTTGSKNNSVQVFVRNLRETWDGRPRISRLQWMMRTWMYAFHKWWDGTHPETPMIDWSKFPVIQWTEEDEAWQEEQWRESNLQAFWFHPDGVDAGLEAHDRFLALCAERGLVTDQQRLKVVHEITGYAPPEPPKALPKPSVNPHTNTIWVTNTASTNTKYLKVYKDKSVNKIYPEKYKTKREARDVLGERIKREFDETMRAVEEAQKLAEEQQKAAQQVSRQMDALTKADEERRRKVDYEMIKSGVRKATPEEIKEKNERKAKEQVLDDILYELEKTDKGNSCRHYYFDDPVAFYKK